MSAKTNSGMTYRDMAYRGTQLTVENLGFFHTEPCRQSDMVCMSDVGQALFQTGYMRLLVACRLTNVMLQSRDIWCYIS